MRLPGFQRGRGTRCPTQGIAEIHENKRPWASPDEGESNQTMICGGYRRDGITSADFEAL